MSHDAQPLDVAIVGMAYRSPAAKDLFAFWENLLANRSASGDVPEPPPSEADPSPIQDVARSALADAGILERLPDRDRLAIIIGREADLGRRERMLEETLVILRSLHPDWSDQDLHELRSNLAPPRPVVEGLDLTRARYVADATGFTALKRGARALVEGRSDLAIVGGVSTEIGVVVLKRLSDAERDGDRIYAVMKGLATAENSAGGNLRAIRQAYRGSKIDPETIAYIDGSASDLGALQGLRAAFRGTTSGIPCVVGSGCATGMAGLIKAALCLHHRMLPATPKTAGLKRLLRGSRLSLNAASRPWIAADASPRRAGVNSNTTTRGSAHLILEEHSASAEGLTPGAMLRWPTEAILLAATDRADLAARVRWLAERLRARPEIDLKDLAATLADVRGGSCRLGLVVESVADLTERLDALAPRLDDRSCRSIRDGRGVYFWENPSGREGGLAFLFPGEGSQYPGMLADLCPHFPEVRALFDVSDRLARESGAIEPPSAMLFGGLGGEEATLWEAGTAVNLVLSSQWALYSLLRKLGLRPSAVVGHSSGEFLALAAAGAFRVDRGLERRFNALALVFSQLDASGGMVPSRLVGLATSRERVEAAIGDLGVEVAVAVDNCPHQVVVAGPHDAVERVVETLRAQGVMTEDLPFSRAYHTSAFAPAIGPLREFFDGLEIGSLETPLYSCCKAGRVPDEPDEIRRLAVDQWTHPVEFRKTIETMHADGLRVFVDVGARGNLAGFVEDSLRGRPSFSVATNLPRRSGLTQLNHLVASLFAQGIEMTPGFLFARRRPVRIDLDAPTPKSETYPPANAHEGRLSADLVARLSGKRIVPPSRVVEDNSLRVPESVDADSFMRSHLETMNVFLRTQGEVMAGYFAGKVDEVESVASEPSNMLPGPWSGEVRKFEPGRSIEAVITLDAKTDPVAEHHTFGGRRISAVDPELKGLPVLPFTVMAEMLAQVAARLEPKRILVGLREIKARRWIRYEDAPIPLEVVAEVDLERPGEIHAALFNRGKAGLGEMPEVEGVIVFGDVRDEPPASMTADLTSPEPSRFDAHSMYAEQWLFHGPAMRAVSEVGLVDDGGIDGTLRVLPRRGLYRDQNAPRPLTDPVVLDSYTHLLGLWGLDRLSEGDVVFPLRLGSLDIFGDDPPEGADCPCRIRVRSVERLKLTVDAEILRPDGRVWMRLTDWDDWRFHWPPRYRDVFRQPEHILLGLPLELPGIDSRDAVAVWLQPPADMGRPVWRDVLEQCQLSPEERSGPLRPEGHEGRRTLRLWGRIAAKEAARRLWSYDGQPPVFPADLSILPEPNGRPVLRSRNAPGRMDMPSVSIAHTEGVAVALASRDPNARIGIDVEKIVDRTRSFEAAAFTSTERALLDQRGGERSEWIARLWCAKEAAAKATGFAMIAGPSSVEATTVDEGGIIGVRLGPELASRCPELGGESLSVRTERRGDTIWAWTIRTVSHSRFAHSATTTHAFSGPHFSEADAR